MDLPNIGWALIPFGRFDGPGQCGQICTREILVMRKLGQSFIDWAQDEDAVRAWQHEHNLAKLLGARPVAGRKWRNDSAGILVRIRNILPEQVCWSVFKFQMFHEQIIGALKYLAEFDASEVTN